MDWLPLLFAIIAGGSSGHILTNVTLRLAGLWPKQVEELGTDESLDDEDQTDPKEQAEALSILGMAFGGLMAMAVVPFISAFGFTLGSLGWILLSGATFPVVRIGAALAWRSGGFLITGWWQLLEAASSRATAFIEARRDPFKEFERLGSRHLLTKGQQQRLQQLAEQIIAQKDTLAGEGNSRRTSAAAQAVAQLRTQEDSWVGSREDDRSDGR